jgi:hypothetical protein
MIRRSFTAGNFGASSRAEAVRRVAYKCWWFVTAARRQGGFLWGGSLTDSVRTPGSKVDTGARTISVDAWRDSEARVAAMGGEAGGRHARLAAKGRGVPHRQGDKLASQAAAGKRIAFVFAGGGWRVAPGLYS